MFQTKPSKTHESGFTIIELLVVLAIIALLFALSTINLGQAQVTASVSSVTDTLLADLKNQQILAMSGGEGSTSSQQPHGIYIQSNEYTLFDDASYNGSDPSNYTVDVNSITLSTTFLSNQVVFDTGDGAVASFTSGDNTITVSGNGESHTITINRVGAITVS
jgi:prepilin-type N-terminal cleavage/methylation domain-containing protein